MATIDLRPQVVDIIVPGGDNVRIFVTLAEELGIPSDANWLAQIRTAPDGALVDSFGITPTPAGATVELTPGQTGALVGSYGALLNVTATGQAVPTGAMVTPYALVNRFTGLYDVQISWGGTDNRTIIKGTLQVDLDISRET